MDDREKLEQELRDERARRRDAESRLDELTERAELWRRRAEERTERVERLLEAQQRKGDTIRKWVRALTGTEQTEPLAKATPIEETSAPEPGKTTRWPTLKATVVVSVVADRGISVALESFDHLPLATAAASDLDRADMMVLEPAALHTLDDDTVERLTDWSRRSARQPLVIWTTDNDLASAEELRRPGDTIVATEETDAKGLGVRHLPGSFDPSVYHPGVGQTAPVDDGSPAQAIIDRAASGMGFSSEPGAGTAARRWAYRHHAPWVTANQLLEAAGVSGRDPTPAIAAVLVSHRLPDVASTIGAILRQTHRPLELVVGLHGAEPTPEIERLLSTAPIPATALTFDSNLTLGECLNLAAGHTTAPLLAKIDDDDHYGPAHLEDSFHALCYSGADIVGKGAHYTYVADRDATVLRRPGMEEAFIDGSPNGATLVFRRETWDRVGFPHRPRHVDTGFLRAARRVDATVYAASRWEFCYVRRADGHTWDAEDGVFTAGSEPAWDGFHPERVEVHDVEPF